MANVLSSSLIGKGRSLFTFLSPKSSLKSHVLNLPCSFWILRNPIAAENRGRSQVKALDQSAAGDSLAPGRQFPAPDFLQFQGRRGGAGGGSCVEQEGREGLVEPAPQAPAAAAGNHMAMPGRGARVAGPQTDAGGRPPVSREKKRNRFRTRGPMSPDSQPEARVSPGGPKFGAARRKNFFRISNEPNSQPNRKGYGLGVENENKNRWGGARRGGAQNVFLKRMFVRGIKMGQQPSQSFSRTKTSGAVPKSRPEG